MKKITVKCGWSFFLFFFISQNAALSSDVLEEGAPLPKYSYNVCFFSPKTTVYVFSKYDPNKKKYKDYETFAIITTDSFKGVPWKNYRNTRYYYLSEGNLEDYKYTDKTIDFDLIHEIEKKSTLKKTPVLTYENISEEYQKTDVFTLVTAIRKAELVSISFGAGLSQGYTPTLEEFYEHVNLVKIPSSDYATDESMEIFIRKILKDSKNYLKEIGAVWSTISCCTVESTPAHLALKKFVDLLTADKDVFIYTSNIDQIHEKCGIKISSTPVIENKTLYENLSFPAHKNLEKKKVVSLIIGQSFDCYSIQSYFYATTPHIEFFSINLKTDPFLITDDTAQKKLLPGIRFLQGNAQTLLPHIVKTYEKEVLH